MIDGAVALGWFVALALEVIALDHRQGPLALNLLAVAAMTGPALWRRRAPLRFAAVVLPVAAAYVAWLSGTHTNIAPLYVLTVVPYSLAAYGGGGATAAAGLAACLAWAGFVTAISDEAIGDLVGTAVIVCVPWGLGRALRARRALNDELALRADRIAAERESRARLAVADERTRIARELHTVVASGVSAMVVQAEVALLLLDTDSVRADAAMAAVESTGRAALGEMRRLLGVLRRGNERPELAPQPGVGQVHALVERARGAHRRVELTVDGEPGPLPASVDVSLYRILEDALATGGSLVGVALRFTDRAVELEVTGAGAPTLAMRERVAICDGEIEGGDGRVLARLPRAFESVFA